MSPRQDRQPDLPRSGGFGVRPGDFRFGCATHFGMQDEVEGDLGEWRVQAAVVNRCRIG